MIPLAELEPRRAYRLQSRNLLVGVYDGEGGFTGIREKFGSRFLDTEYYADRTGGHPGGTAFPQAALATMLPEELQLKETLGRRCSSCGSREIYYVRYAQPIFFYHWVNTLDEGDHGQPGQQVCLGCTDPHPVSVSNTPLLKWLEQVEAAV